MLEGIQFHRELGETTVTVCSLPRVRRPRSRDRWSAAVCPEIPAPRMTTSATEGSLHGGNSCLAYPRGYIQGLSVLSSPTSQRKSAEQWLETTSLKLAVAVRIPHENAVDPTPSG